MTDIIVSRRCCIDASLAVLSVLLPFALAFDSPKVEDIADVRCDTATLTHIDSDSAEIQLTVSGTAKRSLTLESVFFESATVNGMPLRLPPARGPFRFRKGEPIPDLLTLPADVSFREISSLNPLREMVRNGAAHVHVDLLARLDLNPLQMIALHSKTIWVSAHVDQDTPITIPGGTAGQVAAAAALTAAEPLWQLANRGRQWRDHLTAIGDNAQRALYKSLVEVRTSFDIKARGETSQTIEVRNIGIILPSGRILTVEEAVEPWIYAASLAEALKKRDVSIDTGSVETVVQVMSAEDQSHSAFSMRKGELRVVKQQSKTPRVLLGNGHTFERVALREATDNVVLLELPGVHIPVGASTLTPHPDFDDWKKVVVFHFYGPSRLVAWLTDGKQVDGRLTLRDASPDSLGSPIWLQSGVIGILQDDASAETAGALLKDFPSESF